ncbi:MAG: hypothetical protein HY738_13505 [Bacteroidia bacterium]|nr:hypothetical protein [Bacteroidia bacterium]
MELLINVQANDLFNIIRQLPVIEKIKLKKAIEDELVSLKKKKKKRKAGIMQGLIK